MEAVINKRRDFIAKRFGKKVAETLEKAFVGLQATLDTEGAERKQLAQTQKGAWETMATQVDTIISKITDNPPPGIRDQIIATIMGALAEATPAETEAPVEEMAAEDMPVLAEDEEVPMPEDEEEKPEGEKQLSPQAIVMAKFVELSEQVKELAEESHTINHELQDYIPALVEASKAMTALAPLVEKTKTLDNLLERMNKMERALNGRPRRASEAIETITVDDKVKKAIEQGTQEPKRILGVAVKG